MLFSNLLIFCMYCKESRVAISNKDRISGVSAIGDYMARSQMHDIWRTICINERHINSFG